MPGKSRHKKGKYHPQSRKGKSRHHVAAATQQPAVPEPRESVGRPAVPAPSPGAPTAPARRTAVRYPYIATELRTIGVLAGIMLVILVVLFLVLP